MKKIKAAIVGLGRIASQFAEDRNRKGISTHAQAYLADSRVELVAACDLNRERLEAFGSRWGVENLFTDFDEMMRSMRPELVSICTWNGTHELLTTKALAGGAKAIVCEKPLADSLEAADRMIAACKKARVPLLVNCSRRYNADHRRLAAWVRAGGLGDIQAVNCHYSAGVMNTGTHLFDELGLFFGEVKSVWANPDHVLPGIDPTPDLHLQFVSGFGCSVQALDVKKYMQFSIDIYGTKGRLLLEDSGMGARFWKVAPHKVYSGYFTLDPSKEIRIDLSQNLPGLIDNLVRSARGSAKPFCAGEDGRKALEVAVAAHTSLAAGGKRIALPIKNTKLKLASR